MASWGATDANEAKPKWLTAAQKTDTFADSRGWVYRDPNTGLEEVLVAIGKLSAAAKLNIADVTAVNFTTTSLSEGAGGNIDIAVSFNEKITVTGSPTITVTNSQAGSGTDATFTATYQSGSGRNKLTFRATYAAADGGVAEDDVLSIANQNIALAGGTLVDGEAVNAAVAIAGVTDTLTISA
jgi:hypothetical protein